MTLYTEFVRDMLRRKTNGYELPTRGNKKVSTSTFFSYYIAYLQIFLHTHLHTQKNDIVHNNNNDLFLILSRTSSFHIYLIFSKNYNEEDLEPVCYFEHCGKE